MKVKICGITNVEDAGKAAYYGAWAVGFVFHKKSPRYVSPSRAKKIIDTLPPFITPVGVFVNLSDRAIRDICKFTGIRTLQFHGTESPVFCHRFKEYKKIKAFRVGPDFKPEQVKQYNVDAYLFDAYVEGQEGGTGESFNWEVIKDVKFDKPVILSGGLKASNIVQAVDEVSPYAVDISSGVEKSPGIKDPRKIREFFDMLNFKK